MNGFNWFGLRSMIVALISFYMALKNNWITSRETGKKAVFQFYEYSKQACELAMAHSYGQEFNKDKYVHLLGVEFLAKLEKAGRTKQVKDVIDELIKQFNVLLACCHSEKKSIEELLKILIDIDNKCAWMIEEYTFKVYFWNLSLLFK